MMFNGIDPASIVEVEPVVEANTRQCSGRCGLQNLEPCKSRSVRWFIETPLVFMKTYPLCSPPVWRFLPADERLRSTVVRTTPGHQGIIAPWGAGGLKTALRLH